MKKTNLIKMITILSVMAVVLLTAFPVKVHAEENRIKAWYFTLSGIIDEPCNIYNYSLGPIAGSDSGQIIKIRKKIDGNTEKVMRAMYKEEKISSGELTVTADDGTTIRLLLSDITVVGDEIRLEYVDDCKGQIPVENITIKCNSRTSHSL